MDYFMSSMVKLVISHENRVVCEPSITALF